MRFHSVNCHGIFAAEASGTHMRILYTVVGNNASSSFSARVSDDRIQQIISGPIKEQLA